MKATVKFELNGKNTQKTFEVEKNEPNYIIRKLYEIDTRVTKYTFVKTVKCGMKIYQWFGDVSGAGVY